jgi:hypothetical protein
MTMPRPCMLHIQWLYTTCPALQRHINSIKCQHLIPAPFYGGGFSQGRNGRGNRGPTRRCTCCGGQGCNPFGNAGWGQVQFLFQVE